MGITVLKVITN